MLSNKLKLNDEKNRSQAGWFTPGHKPNRCWVYPDRWKKNILLNPHVKNLGVFLDNTLSMEQHISHLCRSAYLAMRQTASICRYLTEKNTVQLVCSFVLSRLDYCNATLAGLPATHIARLQRIQNNAARLVLQKLKKNKKTKKTACHTASQTTTLASDSNTHWLQTCNTCFSTLWWFSVSVSLFKARYISAVPAT